MKGKAYERLCQRPQVLSDRISFEYRHGSPPGLETLGRPPRSVGRVGILQTEDLESSSLVTS